MATIKLADVRTSLKDVKCSYCGIVKQLYALKDDCKELAALLPKDKKTFLTMGETVCKAMKVGETYTIKRKDGKSIDCVRKLSVDMILRYLVSHQSTMLAQVAEQAKVNAEIEAANAAAQNAKNKDAKAA